VQTGAPQMERTTIMSAYVDEWNKGPKRWRYRVQVRLPDGTSKRIQGTPALNTKEAAERAEREHINRLEDAIRNPKAQPKEAPPTFEVFAKTFLEVSGTQNKPSALEAKESILRVHLTPAFGRKPLDRIGFADIQDYVASKTRKGLSKEDDQQPPDRPAAVAGRREEAGSDRSGARNRVAQCAETGI
jgi:hypothetical protein